MARTLNWVPQFDKRSLRWTISEHFPVSGAKAHTRTWRTEVVLDQGEEGACVGFSCAHMLATTPRRRQGMTPQLAKSLYKEAQLIDEWAGEDYEGTSVLAGIKAVNNRGWLNHYYWATSIDEVANAVSIRGPMVMGTVWKSGMWEPDDTGKLHVEGKTVGGHAWAMVGVIPRLELFIMQNSWGREWGQNGRGLISYEDFQKLIDEDAEMCLPMKVIPNVKNR